MNSSRTIFWCLHLGIILLSGCHATHKRRNSLHMDHVWKAINISVESPSPSFIVQPSGVYPAPTNILQRPLFLGYPDLEPSVLFTSYGPFQAQQSLLVAEEESNSKFFVRGHVIDREIHRHTSSIRVFFHLERHKESAGSGQSAPRTKTCLKAEVEYLGLTSTGYCAPKGRPASCLAEIQVLLGWRGNATVRLNVTYAVLPQSEAGRCSPRYSDPWGHGDGIPGEFVGTAMMGAEGRDGDYTLVTEDRLVHMEVPKRAMGLNERFEIPIMVHRQYLCTLRAKMKDGIKVTRIKYLDPLMADHMSMVRSKGTLGMATAEKQQGPTMDDSDEMPVVMSMEFEILNQTEPQRQINWRVDCVNGQDKFASRFVTEVTGSQEWLKEFFPVIKSNDLVNTAVLGSGRVHYPLQVLAVSHGSDVFTVTDQVQCVSANTDVVKVEPDCRGVYLNGSETDGAELLPINITFQGSTVALPLRVWMPELPLTVSLSDDRLSLVKKWKVAREADQPGVDDNEAVKDDNDDHVTCHLTYQTAIVEVLTRFYVPLEDEDEGRRYFSGPDAQQLITDEVLHHLKVANHRVAKHDSRRVTGLQPGVTKVQVVHPHTKAVLGEKKLHVLADKVEVVRLKFTMVSGMSLTFGSIDTENNIFGFNLMALEGFIAQHQEAFLYTTITFDDLTTVALQDLDPSTYSLVVTSSKNQVVALSPDTTPDLPSIITTGQGSTDLMVSFLPAEECQRKRKENCIASDSTRIDISFNSSHPLLNEIMTGNDGEPWMRFSPGVRFVDPGVVRTDISPYYVRDLPVTEVNSCIPQLTNIPIEFDNAVLTSKGSSRNQTVKITSEERTDEEDSTVTREPPSVMEIVLYVFLAIFGIAVILFIVNLFVVVTRYFRKKKPAMSDGIHPQSWIMLGVDWEKRQGNFPLPSDESFHLQESTEGSGREDISSTMSGVSVPQGATGGYSESDDPREGDPLLQRLNNGTVLRTDGHRSDRGGAGCRTSNGSGQPCREPLEATHWPGEIHEMGHLGGPRTSVDIVDESRDSHDQYSDGVNIDIGRLEGGLPREEAPAQEAHDDFVLREVQDMKETAT